MAVVKIHISINVTSISGVIGFYKILLDAEPAKVTPDFAKFELDKQNLNLALNAIPFESGKGPLNHLGFQVNNAEEVQAIGDRLSRAGLSPVYGRSVADQFKLWIYDPDGNEWEVFFE